MNNIIHYRPEDYGLTQEQAHKMKIRYLKSLAVESKKRLDELMLILLKYGENWLIRDYINEEKAVKEKIEKKIHYINNLINNKGETKLFDIEEIKKTPIGDIVKVNAMNKFKIRDEKTPSCHWYRENNTWYDFGSNEGGDVISLVMKIHNINFVEACKMLS